ncbi:hypothetical protein SFRURICE_005656, partial [Spodoptera frugiperda]
TVVPFCFRQVKIFFYGKKMPRINKPKEGAKKRIPIDKTKLELAVKEILKGNTIKGTAKLYDVPLLILKRYARKQQRQPDVKISYKPDYRQSKVFTEEEETELAKYCEKASNLHHGLNSSSVRRLAYQFAVENNKPADKISKWSNNMAKQK